MINDVPVSCINQASIAHHVPATLLLAIMKKENGRNGQAVRNKDGTYDLGVMQVNTRWVKKLSQYGYTSHDLQFNPCKNVMAGSWILANSLADGKNVWAGIGNYHSHTSKYNQSYRASIQNHYKKIVSVVE